jgi:hypothetical protein
MQQKTRNRIKISQNVKCAEKILQDQSYFEAVTISQEIELEGCW